MENAISVENFHSKNWATAVVYFSRTDKSEDSRVEVINTKTLQRYVDDEKSTIAIKALFLSTALIPAYTLLNVACQIVRLATLLLTILINSIANFFKDFSFQSVKKLFINITYEAPAAIITVIWDVVKAPICAVAMEFCAVCCIASPLEWRVRLGDVERFWRGTNRRNHMCPAKEEEGVERIKDFLTNRKSPNAFFLAYCFQPWGSLKDKHIIDWGILPPSDGSEDVRAKTGDNTADLAEQRAQARADAKADASAIAV